MSADNVNESSTESETLTTPTVHCTSSTLSTALRSARQKTGLELTPSCQQHGNRNAELYCQSCRVAICVPCATLNHLQYKHACLDIVDAVVHCRRSLAEQAAEMNEIHISYVERIRETNAKIESIRSESDMSEAAIRRHFEEVRMRLEEDLHRLLGELERQWSSSIKELRATGSAMDEIAVQLKQQSEKLDELAVSGSDGDVMRETASAAGNLGSLLDHLTLTTELPDDFQLEFTKSTLLEQTDNLVGQLQAENQTTTSQAADERNQNEPACRRLEWKCDKCTYKNQDKDIECQMCAYAPWKQTLIGLQIPVKYYNRTAEKNVSRTSWNCEVCTRTNQLHCTRCQSCDTARQAPPAYDSSSETHHLDGDLAVLPRLTISDYSTPGYQSNGIGWGRRRRRVDVDAASTGAAFVVNQATQTDTSEAPETLINSGNCAQKMVNKIRQLVKNQNSSPKSSRGSSPVTACWLCSQCNWRNSMDRMECEQCGCDETVPTALLYK